MQNADIVISSIGSEFSNIIFANRGTKVICLSMVNYLSFINITSTIFGIDFIHQLCQDENELENKRKYGDLWWSFSAIKVDIKSLQNKLDKLINNTTI